MDLDRRWIILIGAAFGLALLAGGFLLGRWSRGSTVEEAAAPTSTTQATTTSSSTTLGDPTEASLLEPAAAHESIDPYGTQPDREEFLDVMQNSGIVTGSNLDLLAAADEVCYHLERLQAQGRSAAYAVRVVWNEALAPLESEDLAAFGTIFVAAPHFLCPENAAYAEEVSYWLGY